MSILLLAATLSVTSFDYYVVVYSYNNHGQRIEPRHTHTFATWVKVKNKQIVDQVDISWGPDTGEVVLFTKTRPGTNKTLKQSLEDAKGKKLVRWVLKTDASFFEAAKERKNRLKYYKALDGFTRPEAVNCIHAVSDVAGFLRTGRLCGIPAGKVVVGFFEEKGRAKRVEAEWLVQLLEN